MKVEPFGRRVGGEKKRALARARTRRAPPPAPRASGRRERTIGAAAIPACPARRRRRCISVSRHPVKTTADSRARRSRRQSAAIFDSSGEAARARAASAPSSRRSRCGSDSPQVRRPRRRLVGAHELAVGIAERQRELIRVRRARRRERGEPAIDRLRQRPGARQRPLVQNRQRERDLTTGDPAAIAREPPPLYRASRACMRRSAALCRTRMDVDAPGRARADRRRVRRNTMSGGSSGGPADPSPQSASNARRSPLCGVAVRRSTYEAREASRWTASCRSESPATPCASSTTTMSHEPAATAGSTSGRLT